MITPYLRHYWWYFLYYASLIFYLLITPLFTFRHYAIIYISLFLSPLLILYSLHYITDFHYAIYYLFIDIYYAYFIFIALIVIFLLIDAGLRHYYAIVVVLLLLAIDWQSHFWWAAIWCRLLSFAISFSAPLLIDDDDAADYLICWILYWYLGFHTISLPLRQMPRFHAIFIYFRHWSLLLMPLYFFIFITLIDYHFDIYFHAWCQPLPLWWWLDYFHFFLHFSIIDYYFWYW